jgi:HK97 family phage major capsid protein
MSVAQIEELRHKRADAFESMKEINDKAEAESRDLTAEEKQEFERLEGEFDSFTERVERQERMEGHTASVTQREAPKEDRSEWDEDVEFYDAKPEIRDLSELTLDYLREKRAKVPASFREFNQLRRGTLPHDAPEYRLAFYKWFTGGPEVLSEQEKRVMSKASAGAGLNLVPTSFQNELIVALRDFGVMRQLGDVVTTETGEALQWPGFSAHGTAAWVAENGAYTASDDTASQTTLNAYKAGTLVKVSEELLPDSAFDLEAYFRGEFGQRIGILENTAYVAGDGSGKPTGVTTQASAGVTAAGAAAITADELIDLYHALSPPYRRNGAFVLNDSTIKLVRKLKDSDGQYLWQPGLQMGQADALLGKPVYADPDMPAATTGLVSVLFGDFSYYKIRDVNGIAFQRLNELYAENGQVGFKAYHRTDGKLLLTSAVKKLTQA